MQSYRVFDNLLIWDNSTGYIGPHSLVYDTEYALAALQSQVLSKAKLWMILYCNLYHKICSLIFHEA